jgi:citrate synthase
MPGTAFTEGLEGIVAAQSAICLVDGQAGRLVYRGYDIGDLARWSTFEETTYLLWTGRLPIRSELNQLSAALVANRGLPTPVLDFLRSTPPGSSYMDVLRTAVSLLGIYDPETDANTQSANQNKALRLTAQVSTLVAAAARIAERKPVVEPDPALSHAANLLYMLTGSRPSEALTRIFDAALILHADHELNASTFAGRVIAATLSDMHSAMVGAICALKGPLHGGANEAVMKMLIKVGGPEQAKSYIDGELAARRRIPGFGHRVYRTWDPRALVLRDMMCDLEAAAGDRRWCNLARIVAETVWESKHLYPNVDFYSAPLYYVLGIPIEVYTPVFAVSRMAGWTAHALEQYANNRLIRPRAEYAGDLNVEYVPIDQRVATVAVGSAH